MARPRGTSETVCGMPAREMSKNAAELLDRMAYQPVGLPQKAWCAAPAGHGATRHARPGFLRHITVPGHQQC